MSLLRRLANPCLGLFAFLLCAAALRLALPRPPIPNVTAKMEAFQAAKNEVQVLFFGSSRVYRQIDPQLFDRVLARRGIALRSFNLGVPAMSFPEDELLLRWVLDQKPPALSHLLIELSPLGLDTSRQNVGTLRNIYWHDGARTWEGLRGSWAFADLKAWHRPWSQNLLHIEAFLYRSLGFGRIPDLLRPWRGRPRSEEILASRGFDPLLVEDSRKEEHQRRLRLLADPAGYRHALHLLWGARQALPEPKPYEREIYGRFLTMIQEAGVEPVFLLTPTTYPRASVLALGAEGVLQPLLDFNDPVRYPRLYVADSRFDREHLNAEGAKIFTRQLARRFAAEVLGGGG